MPIQPQSERYRLKNDFKTAKTLSNNHYGFNPEKCRNSIFHVYLCRARHGGLVYLVGEPYMLHDRQQAGFFMAIEGLFLQ